METKRNSMAVDTLRRYIWLIDLLNRSSYATLEEIQERWLDSSLNEFNEDLPKRTFRNHIEAISNQFGIDIMYKRGFGYYICNPDDINESKSMKWMISSLSMYNTLKDSQGIKDSILLENVPSSHKYLSDFIQAIKANEGVSFMYQSHFSDNAHIVELEPYCLKLFKQRWYVLGKACGIGELRIYALERVDDIDHTGRKYTIPADFNAEEFFYNYYGIKSDGDPETIKLKVIPLEAKYMRSLPIHHSQREIETTDDYSVFELFLSPTWDFKQDLLSRADQVEVLEPASLREWMKEITFKMSKQY